MATEKQTEQAKLFLNYYARVAKPVSADIDLSFYEKMYLMTLGSYNTPEDPFMGQPEMVKAYGIHKNTTESAIASLEKKGLIKKIAVKVEGEEIDRLHLTEEGLRLYDVILMHLESLNKNMPLGDRINPFATSLLSIVGLG